MSEISDRHRKLYGTLGSNIVGELESARAKILEILARHKRTWNDLLEQTVPPTQFPADPDPNGTDAPSSAINALALVHRILEIYATLHPQEYVAVTLWILHAHIFKRFPFTPRLALLSPVRGFRKSTLLNLIKHLLPPNCKRVDIITPAAINSGHHWDGQAARVIAHQYEFFKTFALLAAVAAHKQDIRL